MTINEEASKAIVNHNHIFALVYMSEFGYYILFRA